MTQKSTVEYFFSRGSEVFTRNSKKQDAVVQLKHSTLVQQLLQIKLY